MYVESAVVLAVFGSVRLVNFWLIADTAVAKKHICRTVIVSPKFAAVSHKPASCCYPEILCTAEPADSLPFFSDFLSTRIYQICASIDDWAGFSFVPKDRALYRPTGSVS